MGSRMLITEGDGVMINSTRHVAEELSNGDSESVATCKTCNPRNRQSMHGGSSQNEIPTHLPPQAEPQEPAQPYNIYVLSEAYIGHQQEPQDDEHQQQHPNESLPSGSHPQDSLSRDGSTPHSERDKEKIRVKQHRLILLLHSEKCKQKAGKCLVTPHCTRMTRLWEHMNPCKECLCTFPHCRSSRYILSHYRKCKDSRCQVCNPVREIIQNSMSPRKW